MGGKQSKAAKAGKEGSVKGGSSKEAVGKSSSSISGQNSQSSALTATSGNGVDLAPSDVHRLNGERRKSADLLGKDVLTRAPEDAQKEWEAQLANQQNSAAWNTTVEAQHGTAKFKSTSSLADKPSNSSKELFEGEAAKAPEPAAPAPEPAAEPAAPAPEPATAAPEVAPEAVSEPEPAAAPEEATPAAEASSEPAAAAAEESNGALPPIVFVLGGPGSGKGTICARLADAFNLAHLSLGDYMRKEAEGTSEDSALIAEHMKEGKLVPLEVTLRVLKNAIKQNSDKAGVLLDGFPRALEQAVDFEKVVGQGKVALYFNCEESVMLERLRKRAETSGRADDNEETIAKRLETYREATAPLLEHYRTANLLREVKAEGSIDEVTAAAREHLVAAEFAQVN